MTLLDQLKDQRDALNKAIEALEAVGGTGTGIASTTVLKRSPDRAERRKPQWSEEQRKATADRMKLYWANRRKEEEKRSSTPKKARKK